MHLARRIPSPSATPSLSRRKARVDVVGSWWQAVKNAQQDRVAMTTAYGIFLVSLGVGTAHIAGASSRWITTAGAAWALLQCAFWARIVILHRRERGRRRRIPQR